MPGQPFFQNKPVERVNQEIRCITNKEKRKCENEWENETLTFFSFIQYI